MQKINRYGVPGFRFPGFRLILSWYSDPDFPPLYNKLRGNDQPKRVQVAAMKGMLAAKMKK